MITYDFLALLKPFNIKYYMFNIVSYPLFHRHPNMETPLDVLSRAASFIHANEEDGTFDQPTYFLFVCGVQLRGVPLLCLRCQCNRCTILTVCVIIAILHPCCAASCSVINLGAVLFHKHNIHL